jgi:hypothetical protein
MSSETSGTITLTPLGGQRITISRADIKMMETADASPMPVGLRLQYRRNKWLTCLHF